MQVIIPLKKAARRNKRKEKTKAYNEVQRDGVRRENVTYSAKTRLMAYFETSRNNGINI